jgi:hypothetical protein
MQVILAIPSNQELQAYGGTEEALLRDVSGVPLVVRIVATGLRAGADRVLIVHDQRLPLEVQDALQSSKVLRAALELGHQQVRANGIKTKRQAALCVGSPGSSAEPCCPLLSNQTPAQHSYWRRRGHLTDVRRSRRALVGGAFWQATRWDLFPLQS